MELKSNKHIYYAEDHGDCHAEPVLQAVRLKCSRREEMVDDHVTVNSSQRTWHEESMDTMGKVDR